MREALPTFKENAEGGVFIVTSSIAGVIAGGSRLLHFLVSNVETGLIICIGSMPYSVTKAAQLHLMKCLAATTGPKVRVNAVLPGLVLTDWVNFGSSLLYTYRETRF